MRDPVINSWFPVRETRPGEAQVTQLVTDKMRSEPGYHQPLPPSTGSLGLELLLESGLKVTELGERPSELMGKEELLEQIYASKRPCWPSDGGGRRSGGGAMVGQ